MDDFELLRRFAEDGSGAAFTALVERYLRLVYSAALRQAGDPHLAEDITQAVFIVLARKAKSIGPSTIVSGWLYRTTHFVTADALKARRRRQWREQQAVQMQSNHETAGVDSAWEQIAPHLDEAMALLGGKDRDVVMLRFFENKSFVQIGAMLGLNEDAARKRVIRALEKLRLHFSKRGVVLGTTLIAGAVTANSVQAAPAISAKAISTTALAKGAAAGGSTLTLAKGALKVMAWTKAKTAAVTTVVVALAAISTVSLTGYFRHSPPRQTGRMNLPTGSVKPMIEYCYSSCIFILASDGSLWSWGDERLGWPVLGLSSTRNSTSLRRIGRDNDWASIAVGDSQCLAIKSDGTLWGWGQNLNYQLGDGTKITRTTPVRSVPGNDWKQVAIGSSAFGIKNDGTLWAWGNNWAGQLGTGNIKPVTNAVQIGESSDWAKIWGGGIQTVGIKNDGSLWFWGTLTGGTEAASKILSPTRVSSDTNWTDACFGYFTVLALKSDGTLWTFGNLAHFYTGSTDTNIALIPKQIGADNDWQSIRSSGGCLYHLLRKKDGSLWTLDASEHRIIKPDYKPLVPKKLDFNADIAEYAAGGDNVGVVLTPNGEVWTWGSLLGEHSPEDFHDKKHHRPLYPKYRVIDQPWRVSNAQ